MQTTNRTAVAIGFAAMCAAGLAAQSHETKTTTETKIEIKGGKNMTVTGCLERRLNGDYILTRANQDRSQAPSEYALITDDNLSKHVGERVELKGKAVVDGKGKVSIESTSKTDVDNGKNLETKAKTEGVTGEPDRPFLGVSSLKTLSAFCN